jgi:hypothetical protein
MKINDLELLKAQEYKEYFYNTLYTGWKSTVIKILLAFLLSLLFDLFELFVNYNFLVSYIIIEVLYFNLINKEKLKP